MSSAGKKIPDEVARLRAEGAIPAIKDKRGQFRLDYDNANAILSVILKKIYDKIRSEIDPESAGFNRPSVNTLDAIHQAMVQLIANLARSRVEIPLVHIFGVEPSDRELITHLLGIPSNQGQEVALQSYFRAELAKVGLGDWFTNFFRVRYPLAIRFTMYGSKPAIALVNMDGEDLIQYHITISPDRVFTNTSNGREKVQGYHFSNWFFDDDGTKVQRTYYFNNGRVATTMDSAKAERYNERAAVAAAEAASSSGSSGNEGPTTSAANRKLLNREEKRLRAETIAEQRRQNKQRSTTAKVKAAAEAEEIARKRRHEEELFLSAAIKKSEEERKNLETLSMPGLQKSSAKTPFNQLKELGKAMLRIKTLDDFRLDARTGYSAYLYQTLLAADDDVKRMFYFLINPDNETLVDSDPVYHRLWAAMTTIDASYMMGIHVNDEAGIESAVSKPLLALAKDLSYLLKAASTDPSDKGVILHRFKFAMSFLKGSGLLPLYQSIQKEYKIAIADYTNKKFAAAYGISKGGSRLRRRTRRS